MKRGFTLLELLVVIGIMGLLGTASIGGYRAITRGMQERGAVDNATRFIHSAFQRSLIDRQPVAVYFWNETIRGETLDEPAIVVGKAVAVRKGGRLTLVGEYLCDEFADLDQTYPVGKAGDNGNTTMNLYPMDDVDDSDFNYTLVTDCVFSNSVAEVYLLDPLQGEEEDSVMTSPTDNGRITMCGFKRISGYSGWKVGAAYGFEFQYLTLPHNYIFGTAFSTSMDTPIPSNSRVKMMFGGGGGGYANRSNNISGTRTIQISVLRPNSSGSLAAVKVGDTASPTKE